MASTKRCSRAGADPKGHMPGSIDCSCVEMLLFIYVDFGVLVDPHVAKLFERVAALRKEFLTQHLEVDEPCCEDDEEYFTPKPDEPSTTTTPKRQPTKQSSIPDLASQPTLELPSEAGSEFIPPAMTAEEEQELASVLEKIKKLEMYRDSSIRERFYQNFSLAAPPYFRQAEASAAETFTTSVASFAAALLRCIPLQLVQFRVFVFPQSGNFCGFVFVLVDNVL